MSDTPSDQAPAAVPPPPDRATDLFHTVFVLSRSANAEPGQPVVVEARAYGTYVQQLALRLEGESRRLAARLQDEEALARAARELMQIEAQRGATLQPYLAAPPAPAGGAKAAAGWLVLMARLRDDMARELEALRDARLRLELRKAELINQRKGPQVRIVLRGGAQVQLFFGSRAGNAAEKG